VISSHDNVKSLIDAWKLMSGRFVGSNFQRVDGVASTFANIPLSFFNISFQERPAVSAADLQAMLATMRRRTKACPHPSIIGLCEDWVPEDWQAIAAEDGFTFVLNMTGMAADELLPLRRPSPELEYRRVQHDATARDLAMINAHAYQMPPELWECLCNLQLWHPDSNAYVGYRDGKAVSSAASLPIDGAMYIALVATLPEEHGRGYAEAVMRQAIEQGRAGMGKRRMVLHASDMGQPLYQSMGFGAGCKIALLSLVDAAQH
jgi:ribosomal protein S18 acetylase RimI-like enzyme